MHIVSVVSHQTDALGGKKWVIQRMLVVVDILMQTSMCRLYFLRILFHPEVRHGRYALVDIFDACRRLIAFLIHFYQHEKVVALTIYMLLIFYHHFLLFLIIKMFGLVSAGQCQFQLMIFTWQGHSRYKFKYLGIISCYIQQK